MASDTTWDLVELDPDTLGYRLQNAAYCCMEFCGQWEAMLAWNLALAALCCKVKRAW